MRTRVRTRARLRPAGRAGKSAPPGPSTTAVPPIGWPRSLATRDLLSLRDLAAAEVEFLLELGAWLKANRALYRDALVGKTLALVFQKPSLRTRATFEIGIRELGGSGLYLGPQEVGLGSREAVKDVAQNLSRWVDGIVARVFSHESLAELARHASVPVINALSSFEHPCQALGDYLTLRERRRPLAGTQLAWVGDGNNVVHSLIYGAAKLGVRMVVATPPGYEPDAAVVAAARREGGQIQLTHDPTQAVTAADAIYTDVWASMGQEAEADARREIFRPYQVNRELLRRAPSGALFMHCLPARRGEEVTDEVIDSPNSVVYDQAENRLHIQKAILLGLLQ